MADELRSRKETREKAKISNPKFFTFLFNSWVELMRFHGASPV